MSKKIFVAIAALVGLSLAGPGPARAEYPEQPIRKIYPYAAGGAGDALARLFAEGMSGALGQQVIVDNRAGAGGNIGFSAAARAAPDGYTLLSVSPAFAVNASLYKAPGYDPVKDFVAVAPLSVVPNVLVVHPSVPANTLAELIAYAKANPGKVNYASSGVGTSIHMAAELLKSMTGIDIVHVPYRGAAQAGLDLVGGQVQMMFDSAPTALAQIRSGRVKAIAIASTQRLPEIPDVQTTAEAGYPDLLSEAWTGIVAPAGTPPAIVAKLHAVAAKLQQDPTLIERLRQLGGRPFTGTPEFFAEFIRRDVERNAAVVKAANLSAE